LSRSSIFDTWGRRGDSWRSISIRGLFGKAFNDMYGYGSVRSVMFAEDTDTSTEESM
jgi:hypothetical protein